MATARALAQKFGFPEICGIPLPAPPTHMPVTTPCPVCKKNIYLSQYLSHMKQHGYSQSEACKVANVGPLITKGQTFYALGFVAIMVVGSILVTKMISGIGKRNVS